MSARWHEMSGRKKMKRHKGGNIVALKRVDKIRRNDKNRQYFFLQSEQRFQPRAQLAAPLIGQLGGRGQCRASPRRRRRRDHPSRRGRRGHWDYRARESKTCNDVLRGEGSALGGYDMACNKVVEEGAEF